MKVMKRFLMTVLRVFQHPVVKYSMITIVGVVLVCFVGDNSLLAHIRNRNYIDNLTEEIDMYNTRSREDMRQIRQLNTNPKATERIARERYFMKHDDEDIFVLSDDERVPQSIVSDDETAE